jgi:hypothetical protein
MIYERAIKKCLKIPKGESEAVNQRRTEDTMAKRKGQMSYKNYTENLRLSNKSPTKSQQ